MSTPFSVTSYTNELIQDKQARSVGDVLQNDAGVRVARGFGNFQESYFIRGFILSSDDVAYNGLYSLLPRQYIATELFERVEVLRGASAFLTGRRPVAAASAASSTWCPSARPTSRSPASPPACPAAASSPCRPTSRAVSGRTTAPASA
ncbi:Plug domain-containing protein [Achromobacter xylosoxidans]